MKELTKEEERVLDAVDFGDAEISADSLLSASQLEDDSPEACSEPKVPKMTDAGWSKFVMTQFFDDELDENGRPLVHGLRRVVRALLGPIISSKARVVQAPSLLPSSEKLGLLQPAVVEYSVRLLMCRLEGGMSEAYEVEFTDAADCYYGNIGEPEFARFLTATASTRAEGRALRKALQLNTIASEEKSSFPAFEAASDGKITPTQVNFLKVLCERNDIDLLRYVASGKNKYENIFDVPYGTAAKMVEHLSNMQNGVAPVPPEIKGFDKKWDKGLKA
jgi:hypothetical protein